MAGNVREHISPSVLNLFGDVHVWVGSHETVGPELLPLMPSGWSSAVYTANLAMYLPLITAEPVLVSQFWWINGATVSGNTDVGIYSADGTTKLGSTGSTANAGTNSYQAVNVTDFVLGPNQRYWLAFACDNATQTFTRNALAVSALDAMGIKQQTSAWSSGLPSSATFAAPTVAYIHPFGFRGTFP